MAAAVLVVIPWYWHLQNTVSLLQLGHTLTNVPSWVSLWCQQASTCLHDFSSLGPSATTEPASSPMTLLGFSSAKRRLIPMTPSWLQTQRYLGDSYTTQFSCRCQEQPCPPPEHSFCVLTLQIQLPEDFTSVMVS